MENEFDEEIQKLIDKADEGIALNTEEKRKTKKALGSKILTDLLDSKKENKEEDVSKGNEKELFDEMFGNKPVKYTKALWDAYVTEPEVLSEFVETRLRPDDLGEFIYDLDSFKDAVNDIEITKSTIMNMDQEDSDEANWESAVQEGLSVYHLYQKENEDEKEEENDSDEDDEELRDLFFQILEDHDIDSSLIDRFTEEVSELAEQEEESIDPEYEARMEDPEWVKLVERGSKLMGKGGRMTTRNREAALARLLVGNSDQEKLQNLLSDVGTYLQDTEVGVYQFADEVLDSIKELEKRYRQELKNLTATKTSAETWKLRIAHLEERISVLSDKDYDPQNVAAWLRKLELLDKEKLARQKLVALLRAENDDDETKKLTQDAEKSRAKGSVIAAEIRLAFIEMEMNKKNQTVDRMDSLLLEEAEWQGKLKEAREKRDILMRDTVFPHEKNVVVEKSYLSYGDKMTAVEDELRRPDKAKAMAKLFHAGHDPIRILNKIIRVRTEDLRILGRFTEDKAWMSLAMAVKPTTSEMAVQLLSASRNIVVFVGSAASHTIPRNDILERIRKKFPTLGSLKAAVESSLNKKSSNTPIRNMASAFLSKMNETPHSCHKFLSSLDNNGQLLRVYTENVDALEAEQKLSSVCFVNGHLGKMKCRNCQVVVEMIPLLRDQIKTSSLLELPCPKCGQKTLHPDFLRVKGDVEKRNEVMDLALGRKLAPESEDVSRAAGDLACADLILILGTPMKSYPFDAMLKQLPAGVHKIWICPKTVEVLPEIPFTQYLIGKPGSVCDYLFKKMREASVESGVIEGEHGNEAHFVDEGEYHGSQWPFPFESLF